MIVLFITTAIIFFIVGWFVAMALCSAEIDDDKTMKRSNRK